jgi:hypothetical protein
MLGSLSRSVRISSDWNRRASSAGEDALAPLQSRAELTTIGWHAMHGSAQRRIISVGATPCEHQAKPSCSTESGLSRCDVPSSWRPRELCAASRRCELQIPAVITSKHPLQLLEDAAFLHFAATRRSCKQEEAEVAETTTSTCCPELHAPPPTASSPSRLEFNTQAQPRAALRLVLLA